ncbi:MAG: cbb3-type cytochrome oxidase assembly protein [Euryarchaeota archaeon]|nr:cbb3-type cytochrome oxidase assembly protein [Euryarchaeota archaeon]
MEGYEVAVAATVLLSLGTALALLWAIRAKQFDEEPKHRMLEEE